MFFHEQQYLTTTVYYASRFDIKKKHTYIYMIWYTFFMRVYFFFVVEFCCYKKYIYKRLLLWSTIFKDLLL